MANPNASRDSNFVPTLLGQSSVDATAIPIYADPTTHRLLVDLPGGTGTVTSVSVTSANGFAGTVANATTTPAITLTTSATGVLKGSGSALVTALNSDLPTMTATVGGAVPTPPNNTTTFLRGDGTFATPATGSGTVTSVTFAAANGFTGTTGANTTTTPVVSVGTALLTPVIAGDGTGIIAGTVTGTGSTVVLQTSPVLTTPNIGVATATSVNGLKIATTTGTLAIGTGDTLTVNDNATLGTGGLVLGNSGGLTVSPSKIITVTDSTTLNRGSAAFANGKVLTLSDSTTLDTNSITLAGGEVVTFTAVNPLSLLTSTTTSITFPGGTGTAATLAATQTLTNKRITKRVVSVGTSATPTINTDNGDIFEIVNQNVAITSMTTNLSGTPLEGDFIEIAIKDAGTSVGITWGTSFGTTGLVTSLPTATGTSAVLRTLFQYQTSAVWAGTSAWMCVAAG